MRMRLILLSSLTCVALRFLYYLTNGTIFEKNVIEIENETCVLIFSVNFVRNASHPKDNRAGFDYKSR